MSSNASHIHYKCMRRTFADTNQVRNGIKDFKEHTLSWTSAMDYRLVKPVYYVTGMFTVDERSALALTVM